MKYLIKHTILFILLSIIFSSCVKYVDLEHLRPDPKLVLNCVAQTGMPLTATVSRTWFYTDENPNITIEDAKISLYVNGQYREDMTWHVEESEYNSAAYYKASYIPSDGDKIRLEVEKDGFKDISAECVLPVKPELLKLEVVREKDTGSYDIIVTELFIERHSKINSKREIVIWYVLCLVLLIWNMMKSQVKGFLREPITGLVTISIIPMSQFLKIKYLC